jgi:hypothetical protein
MNITANVGGWVKIYTLSRTAALVDEHLKVEQIVSGALPNHLSQGVLA